jgi:hypothetical protein
MRSANFFTGPPSRKNTLIDSGFVFYGFALSGSRFAPQESFLGREHVVRLDRFDTGDWQGHCQNKDDRY